MSLELQSCLTCNTSPITNFNSETIAFAAANSVVLWSTAYNRKEVIWHGPITTCAAKAESLAIGEEGLNPKIAIYKNKRQVTKLEGGASMMYSALAWDSSRLVSVGDYPKFQLKVWEGETCLATEDLLQEPTKVICRDAVLLLMKHEIKLLRVYKGFQIPYSNANELREKWRSSISKYDLKDSVPLDATFDKYNNIYVSTNAGELLVLSMDLKNLIAVENYDFNILSMALTHRYLVVATTESKIQWLNIYIPPQEEDPRLEKDLNFKPQKELLLEESQQIVQMLYTEDMLRLVLVSARGKLQVLHQSADPDFDVEDEEEEQEDEELNEDADYEDQPRKLKVLNLVPQVLGQFHVENLKAAVPLGESSQVATIAEDLRVWEVVTGENLFNYPPLEAVFTSLDSNFAGTLIAVGSSAGVVRMFDVANRMFPRLLVVHKILESPITQVLFGSDQKLIACASDASNQIYFLETSKFRVIGHVQMEENVISMCWSKNYVLALLRNGLLAYFEAPRPEEPSKLEPLQVQVKFRYIEGKQVAASQTQVYVAGASKQVYIYEFPSQSLSEIDMRKSPPQPYDNLPAHEIMTKSLVVSSDNRYLAVGSKDGSLKLIDLVSQNSEVKLAHSSVEWLRFSNDSGLLLSAGKERDFFCWNLGEKPLEKPLTLELEEDPSLASFQETEDSQDNQLTLASELLRRNLEKEEAKQVAEVKQNLKDKLVGIQEKLKTMLDMNEKVPELEKLDRDEFVLDLAKKQEIEQQGQLAADALREKAKRENLRKEILKERIKHKTINAMQVNSKVIASLNSKFEVYNFTLRKLSKQEENIWNKVKALRLMEFREQKLRQEKGISDPIKPEQFQVDWIIGIKPEEWKNHPLLKELTQRREAEAKENDPKLLFEWDLLYSGPQVYTTSRKRLQIYLLHMLCRAFKEGFNLEFEKLENLKEKQLESIEEKNALIAEKQQELNTEINTFKAESHPLEDPQEMLKVREEEITVEKYLTKEEKVALEEKRRKEEERLRLLNSDDSKKQALYNMMWGTIENKSTKWSMLDKELVREEWMDTLTLQEMTEEQRQKLKEFEEKQKKLEEDKEKLRKILEGELKKLQNEVVEIHKNFDEKLEELFLLRLNTEYEVYQMELMIARLTLSIIGDSKKKNDVSEMQTQKAKWEKVHSEKENELSEIKEHIERLRNKAGSRSEDAKNIENNFKQTLRKDYPNFSERDRAMSLLREGVDKRSSISKSQNLVEVDKKINSLNPLDPFTPYMKKKILQNAPAPPPREIDPSDKASFPPAIGEMLEKERKKKVAYEKEIREYEKYASEVEFHKSWIEEKSNKAKSKVSQSQEKLAEFESAAEKQLYNTDLLLSMKQEILEVAQMPVVTDYSDAILINTDVVETRNRSIKDIGSQKVEILRKIAESKILFTKVQWEEQLLKLETEDFIESEGDLKMLKIDKRIQNILSGRGLDENQQLAERMRIQIETLNSNTENRVRQLREKRMNLQKSIEELRRDNEVLDNEVYEMKKQEEQREQLIQLRGAISDQARDDPRGKFKQVSNIRRMMDTIEQYREEMEFLNDELDRLRAKTFPSFAHLQPYPELPDEV